MGQDDGIAAPEGQCERTPIWTSDAMNAAASPEGILAIWTDVIPEQEAVFEDWYNRQHLPERRGAPGFLSSSRHRAISGGPRKSSGCSRSTTEMRMRKSRPVRTFLWDLALLFRDSTVGDGTASKSITQLLPFDSAKINNFGVSYILTNKQ